MMLEVADLIMIEGVTQGAMTKTLNHQSKLNRLSQTGACQMGQERWIMVESVKYAEIGSNVDVSGFISHVS